MTGSGGFRPVSGVGDSAFVLDERGLGTALCVFLGEYYLQVSAFGLGDAGSVFAAVKELARQALSQL